MQLTMIWTIIPVLLLLNGLLISGDYYIHRTLTNVDYNNPPCKLATPSIGYSSEGSTVYLPSYVDIDLHDLFVGYTKVLETFEYIGCVWDGDLQQKQWISIQVDPGQCYSACRSTYFGIHEHRCYCLNEKPRNIPDTESNCRVDCSFPRYTICGGHIYYSGHLYYISLYKHVPMNTKDVDDWKYCRVYNQVSGSFLWQMCETRMKKGLCQTEESDKPFAVIDWPSSYAQWNEYSQDCFVHNMYPATENKSRIDNTAGRDVWIGRIRSWVIVNVTRALEENNFYGYYGYISNRSNTLLLEFTKVPVGYVLCENDAATTMVTPNDQTGDIQGDAEESRSSVKVAAYVTSPLVVIIAVAIVVLVIQRRKRNQANAKGTPDVVYSNGIPPLPANDDNATFVANVTYPKYFVHNSARHPTEADTQEHDYIACEKANVNSATLNTSSHDIDNETYDTSHAIPKVDAKLHGNVYNRLSEFSEDTYNHTGKGNETVNGAAYLSESGKAAENVYDAFSKDDASKNVYNTTDEDFHVGSQRFEDIYSHIKSNR